MAGLTNKTILILSPQSWGNMFVSKHHYAIELAKRGNAVFFLNPPEQGEKIQASAIQIRESKNQTNLYLINHVLFFPYQLRFRALPLFHWLMKFHIRKLLNQVGRPIDIVWSFDMGNLYPLNSFKGSYKIFHPVDEPLISKAINSAVGADIIFSVTTEILEKYHSFNVSKHFVNHGVTDDFIVDEIKEEVGDPIRIGFSGNLLRADIDRGILLTIVGQNLNCVFEFWGSYTQEQGNVGGTEDQSVKEFIQALKLQPNTVLHGAIPSSLLATELRRMDAFLICYDVKKDWSRGTNYHKIMEYLATGKVIISNNVTTYHDLPHLIKMVSSRENNKELPSLFSKVIESLNVHNSAGECFKRSEFAKENTYNNQLEKIQHLINL